MPTVQKAEAAARRGEHAAAGQIYEALAQSAPAGNAATNANPDAAGATAAASGGNDAASLRLRAASEWLLASRSVEAARLVNALAAPGVTLSAEQTAWRRTLDADIALANGQSQQAWEKITAIAEPGGANGLRYLDARMRIAMAASRPIDSIRAEAAAERLVADVAGRGDWRNRLLALLRGARERGIKLDAAASNDATIKGWLELGALMGSARGASLTGGSDAARWRARYPGHPALDLVADALPSPIAVGSSIGSIALLLPITSSAVGAEARAIRDGFQFALSQLPGGTQPTLKVYDTATTPSVEQFAVARAEGNNFIVGPLVKADVSAVATSATGGVPILALNTLANEARVPDEFYQFALSPEDEARGTARRILAEGLRRGIALVPNGEWGTRVSNAFSQEFLSGGGVLVSQAAYDTAGTDYSAAIKQTLGVNESEARMRRMQTLTGLKLEFETRRRADLQFIYAAARQANSARLLHTQIYQYALNIPTYMTSDSYTAGSKDANEDLDGVKLPGMPWLLPDASLDATRSAAQLIGASAPWQSPYFAFGYDACQLALSIASSGRNVSRLRIAGITGQLTIDAAGHVQREQLWAQIKGGEAQLLGNADSK